MKHHDLGAAQTGFHDWYWQRISAVLLLILLPIILTLLFMTRVGSIDYVTLHQWFSHPAAKTLISILFLAIGLHIWTGLKVIFEDYLHHSSQRILILNTVLLGLLACGIYGLFFIWADANCAIACLTCNEGGN